jgi:hypothetical protein
VHPKLEIIGFTKESFVAVAISVAVVFVTVAISVGCCPQLI